METERSRLRKMYPTKPPSKPEISKTVKAVEPSTVDMKMVSDQPDVPSIQKPGIHASSKQDLPGPSASDIADASTKQELEDEAKQLQDLLDKSSQGVRDAKAKWVKDYERSKEANQLEKESWEKFKMVMEKDAFDQGCVYMASCLRRAGVDLSVEALRKMMDTDPFDPELVRFHPQIPYSDKEIANQLKKDPLFTLPPVEEDNLRVRVQRHYNELARVAEAAKGAVAEGNDVDDDEILSNDDDDDVMEAVKSSSCVSGKDSSVASNGEDSNEDEIRQIEDDADEDGHAGSGSKA